MKKYLSEFLEIFSYPEESRAVLEQAYDKIFADVDLKNEFQELLMWYENNSNCDYPKCVERMKNISAKAGFHEYTGGLLLFICFSKKLREYYHGAGFDELIWFTSMSDLRYKLIECRNLYGIWGASSPMWFHGFFVMLPTQRFGFGKLQFEMRRFGRNYEKENTVLNPDSCVINVHIPRTGTRLDNLAESYAKAAEFYKERFQIKKPVFVCKSWMLYSCNAEILKPDSNILAFMADYDVIEQGEYEDYSQVWRIFDQFYTGNVEQLPKDSSLRRGYADWIEKGKKTGWGYGVYLYK